MWANHHLERSFVYHSLRKSTAAFVTSDLCRRHLRDHNDRMATLPVQKLSAQQVSHAIITAAMRVHSELGPGLLESTYTACLQYELMQAGFRSASQVGLPVVYRGVRLELGYRIDLLV